MIQESGFGLGFGAAFPESQILNPESFYEVS